MQEKVLPLSPVPPLRDEPPQPNQLPDSRLLSLDEPHRALAEHTHRLRTLFQVIEQLNQEADLSGVIGVTLSSLCQVADIDVVAIVLGEDELGPFHFAGIRGVQDPLSILGQECPLPLWGSLAQALVHHPKEGEPDYLVIHDIETEQRPLDGEFPWPTTQGSLLIIPMRQAGKTVGAFLDMNHNPNYFLSESLRYYLYVTAGTTARAIQEAQARQQAARWIKQLVSLQSLTRTITRTRRLNAILNVLHEELNDLFGDAEIQVFLNRPPQHNDRQEPVSNTHYQLWLYTPEPISAVKRAQLVSPELMALVHWAMQAEQPLFFDPATYPDDMTDFYYRSSGRGLIVPIGEDKPEGVIYLSAPKRSTPFEESDLIVVRTIASSIAIAIGNSYLYEKLNHQPQKPATTNGTGANSIDGANR